MSRPPISREGVESAMKEMKTYKAVITETLQKTVYVEAASEEEAHRRVRDAWKNAEYILDADSFKGVEFFVYDEAEEEPADKGITRIDPKDIDRGDGEGNG